MNQKQPELTPEQQEQLDAIFGQMQALQELENAPATLEEGIVRIMALEDCLDDLARSFEILQYYTGNNSVGDFARQDAVKLLETRIRRPDSSVGSGEMNITVVE